MHVSVKQLALQLFRSGSLRYGDFTLSSGRKSSFYIDLRLVPSNPKTFKLVIYAYTQALNKIKHTEFKSLACVPTTGLIFCSVLSYIHSLPMIYVRKDKKDYGTKKEIEGYFERGDNVLIIDDVSTSGNSIMDIANKLRSAGCIVKDALVLVDRMEGAIQNLKNNGIRLHYFATINELQPYIHNILEKEQK
jgi:orotate phosphoribosyltransferase